MATPFIDLIPKVTVAEGLYIDIKTRSDCDHRNAEPQTYAENWATDIWVAGQAIGQAELKLWHPDDPVPQVLTPSIPTPFPIISYHALFVRTLFSNILRPPHS